MCSQVVRKVVENWGKKLSNFRFMDNDSDVFSCFALQYDFFC